MIVAPFIALNGLYDSGSVRASSIWTRFFTARIGVAVVDVLNEDAGARRKTRNCSQGPQQKINRGIVDAAGQCRKLATSDTSPPPQGR